ncbi:MAG: NAD(P)/FAD-dependent oxidoreductase, partial [Mycobacteriales bacterium]
MSGETCDVLVIGAGMAGASVAAALAEHAQVVLVEAETAVPFHTTGRSAAMYMPNYGSAVVRRLTAESLPFFATLIEEWGAPALLSSRDILYVGGPGSAEAVSDLRSLGLEELSPGAALKAFPALRPEAIHDAVLDTGGSDIDVLAMHAAYLRALRHHRGTVVQGSRVKSLDAEDGGWRVDTDTTSWSCGHVVNAAGAWADQIADLARQPPLGLRPMLRSAFIAPVQPPPGFRDWPLVMDAEERWYARPEGDALLASPADETPVSACDARPDELEVARALDALREAMTFPLRSVRTAWAGLRTFTPDRTPVVGESQRGSRFWWCAGQGGYGIQSAPATAVLTADLVLGRPVDTDLSTALSPSRFTSFQA